MRRVRGAAAGAAAVRHLAGAGIYSVLTRWSWGYLGLQFRHELALSGVNDAATQLMLHWSPTSSPFADAVLQTALSGLVLYGGRTVNGLAGREVVANVGGMWIASGALLGLQVPRSLLRTYHLFPAPVASPAG
jgi:hypothetical protein